MSDNKPKVAAVDPRATCTCQHCGKEAILDRMSSNVMFCVWKCACGARWVHWYALEQKMNIGVKPIKTEIKQEQVKQDSVKPS